MSNTATFIQHLKDKEMQNLHAWSLEKTLSAQAINSLTVQVNNLDHELEVMTRERDIALQQLEHANREIERWKKACLETNDSPADGVAADLQTDDNGK